MFVTAQTSTEIRHNMLLLEVTKIDWKEHLISLIKIESEGISSSTKSLLFILINLYISIFHKHNPCSV